MWKLAGHKHRPLSANTNLYCLVLICSSGFVQSYRCYLSTCLALILFSFPLQWPPFKHYFHLNSIFHLYNLTSQFHSNCLTACTTSLISVILLIIDLEICCTPKMNRRLFYRSLCCLQFLHILLTKRLYQSTI